MKKFLSFILAAACLCSCLSGAVFAADEEGSLSNFERVNVYRTGIFPDVPAGEWYENFVASAYELDLMKGDDYGSFNPKNNISCAEALTLACIIHSIYHTGGKAIPESAGEWYARYVDYALANGIIDAGFEDYGAAISRGDFAALLAMALPASTLPPIREIEDDQLPDVKMGDRNAEVIYMLYRAGVLSGNDARGTFAPDTPITRCAVAGIITNLVYRSLRDRKPLEKWEGTELTEGERKEDDFFSNSAMLGNSLVQGMSLYSKLSGVMDFHCYQSLNVYSIISEGYVAKLCQGDYDRVYIELGVNEIYMEADKFTAQYGKIVDMIRDAMPDADIYIMAITPVTKAVNDKGSFTMAKIRSLNEALEQLARDKECLYLDICEPLCGQDGYLVDSYKGWDGSPHLSTSGYLAWEEVIRTYYKD